MPTSKFKAEEIADILARGPEELEKIKPKDNFRQPKLGEIVFFKDKPNINPRLHIIPDGDYYPAIIYRVGNDSELVSLQIFHQSGVIRMGSANHGTKQEEYIFQEEFDALQGST